MAIGKDGASLKITKDGLRDLQEAIARLASLEVLVGFPEDTAARDDEDGGKSDITNAALAFIHNNGAPEQNIPAREFMASGIAEGEDLIASRLLNAGKRVLKDPSVDPRIHLDLVGLAAQLAIRKRLNSGVPPPLADVTLERRAAKGRKGAKKELERRAAGELPGTDLAKPLIDTAQLRNAVNYVIRPRSARKE